MKIKPSFILAVLTLQAFPVLSADVIDEAKPIEEIVVTASRVPQPITQVVGDITVIGREQIIASGALDLSDVLSQQSGLTVVRSGGVGSQTSVFMRGAESDHALLLVNGVRYNSAADGAAPWADIPLENIERIEIVRGAKSSLYGSDAIGGVVQVITKRQVGAELSLTAGSHGSRAVGFNAGASGENLSFSLYANNTSATGIDATTDNTAPRQLDKDGYSRRTIGANATAQLGFAELLLDWQQVRNRQDIDGFGSTEQATRIDGGSARLTEADGGLDWAISYGLSKQDFGSFSGTRELAELQLSYQAKETQYLVALGREETSGEQQFGYSEEFDSKFALAQVATSLGAVSVQASLRSDDYSGFGEHNTGNLSLGLDVTDALEISVHYGTGFRAPALNNLFAGGFANDFDFDGNVDEAEDTNGNFVLDPGEDQDGDGRLDYDEDTNGDGQFDEAFAGNPNLKPEESDDLSVSISYMAGVHHWALSVFDIQIENLVSFTGFEGNFVFRADNQAEAKSKGIELSWSADWQRYSAGISATVQRTEDDKGDQQLRRPDEYGNAYLNYKTDTAGTYGVSVRASSGHLDFLNKSPFNKVNTSGYAVVNLNGQWSLGRGTLTAKLENVLDKEYEQAVGFSTPGFGGFLNYRLAW